MPTTADADYTDTSKFGLFPSRRSVVHSTKGIVSASQPLAARCGQIILEKGGNAADAAVAVAAGLNVTEPCMTGIGGDAFCLFYDAKQKRVRGLNGSGRSGEKYSLERVRKDLNMKDGQDGGIPTRSVLAVTVPGAAAAWVDTVERFGSGKVTLAEVLEPATKLAEEGYPVSEWTSYLWGLSESLIKSASPNGGEMLRNGERKPETGEIFKNPTLATTFRTLGKEGRKGFYEGRVAEQIVKVVQDLGGRLTLDDLKKHGDEGSQNTEPVSIDYDIYEDQPVRLWEHPPNGQGLVALLALGIVKELQKQGKVKKFGQGDHLSTAYLHALIEAMRIAFADGTWFITDPDVEQVPVKSLLEPAYLAERAKLFDPSKASPILEHGSPAHNSSDTVYFSVTDSEGNGCSFINSNYGGFGTAIIPKGCGFTLQNRGANFSLDPKHPNAISPGKRPYHTIIPAMLTNPADDSLHSVYGVMGGFMQPQGHVQVLLNTVAFGLDAQAALDAPRFCIGAGSGTAKDYDRTVFLEEGIPDETVQGLAKLGHKVEVLKGKQRGMFGRGQLIRCRKEDGQIVYSAGSDMRADGHAVPML